MPDAIPKGLTRGRPAPRLGPRPLGLHLANQLSILLNSRAGLPPLKAGSPPWNLPAQPAAAQLRDELAGVDPEGFAAALDAESRRRIATFLHGIRLYRAHPYRRPPSEAPVAWRAGTTKVLRYGGEGGAPVLLVPSLVNRAYILDLSERRSLARYLAGRGLRPYLVDWDEPGEVEAGYDLGDYIARLESALEAVAAENRRGVGVVGYCMGGLLALALAARRPDKVAALALLATPWDFHAGGNHALVIRAMAPQLSAAIAAVGHLPVDVLQAFFTSVDPTLADRKYRGFAALSPRSRRAEDFVVLEDWVNDGVPLAARVATDCLFGWYGANQPACGEWRVGGTPVRPEDVRAPALVLVPEKDRLVPPQSALAIARTLPAARHRLLPVGHIGMISGRRATTLVYGPLSKWLGACCSAT